MRVLTGVRAVAVITAAALVVGCAGTTPSVSPAASAAESAAGSAAGSVGVTGKTFIYITPTPLGGDPFLQAAKEATDLAAKQFGGTSKTFESADVEGMTTNVKAAIAEHPDVIVLVSYAMTDIAKESAEANPGQQFILIDDCPATTSAKNLHCGVFRDYEPAYLVGYEAGLLTKSNKIGSVVAEDVPFQHRYSDSFKLGAQAANPEVTATALFVGGPNPYTDIAKAKELALQLAAGGADSIFAVGEYGGTFEAAKEKGFDAYGVDYNQCGKAPGHVADGVVKRQDVVVLALSAQIFAGTAPFKTSFGLKENGMDIVSLAPGAETSGCRVMQFPDVLTKLKDIRQQIVDGKITIPDPAAI